MWPHRSRMTAVVLAAGTFAAVLSVPIRVGRTTAHPLWQPGATATPTPRPSPVPADLIVDNESVVLSGPYVLRHVIVRNNGRITIGAYSGIERTGRLDIVAERIEIDGSSSIIGVGAGYRGLERRDGEGPGGGEGGARTLDGGAGGGHGGKGGDGVMDNVPQPGARGGRPYGDAASPVVDRGSAGGAPGTADSSPDWASGGNGGGAVTLVADTILITGTIRVDGTDGIVTVNDAAGGGAGGGVLVHARHLEQSGRIEARGGYGGLADDGGGGGGGGRIKIYYESGNVTRDTLKVDGGRGDGNGYANDGDPGTIHVEVLRPLTVRAPAFLPLTLRADCTRTRRRLDVVLAIDTSSSMQERTLAGGTKLETARAAAGVFLDLVSWAAGNQAALVTFDAEARLAQSLTADRSRLDIALAAMTTARQTCLPCAVAEADRELASPRRRTGNTPVLLLLTDGKSNPRPMSEAVRAAQVAKARGVLVFTIGVGEDLDEAGLAAMASQPAYYYRAPDAAALEAIFRTVAVTIPCALATPHGAPPPLGDQAATPTSPGPVTRTAPPPVTRTPTANVAGSVRLNVARPPTSCHPVDLVGEFMATSRVAPVDEMRTSLRGYGNPVCSGIESEVLQANWRPFAGTEAYSIEGGYSQYAAALGVQYRDGLGNLSPVYCHSIVGVCLHTPTPSGTWSSPTPSPTASPTASRTPWPGPPPPCTADPPRYLALSLRPAGARVWDLVTLRIDYQGINMPYTSVSAEPKGLVTTDPPVPDPCKYSEHPNGCTAITFRALAPGVITFAAAATGEVVYCEDGRLVAGWGSAAALSPVALEITGDRPPGRAYVPVVIQQSRLP